MIDRLQQEKAKLVQKLVVSNKENEQMRAELDQR